MLKIFRVQDPDYSRSASHPILQMAAGESGSEDCRTLVSIQRVAALNSFNVQRSPKLQCNSIFPTSRRFCTNERVDSYIGVM